MGKVLYIKFSDPYPLVETGNFGMLISEAIVKAMNGRWKNISDAEHSHSRAKKVMKILGDIPIHDVISKQPQLVSQLRSKGLKGATINKYLATLSGLGATVKYVPQEEPMKRVLRPEEIKRLDASVKSHTSARCKAVYAILRDTGCRGLTELRRFDFQDIDWEAKIVRFRSHKTKSGEPRIREIPLTAVAERAFSWLYHNDSLPGDSEWRAFWLSVRLDKDNKPYDLRHTFCTRLLDSGVSLPLVSKIMGHSKVEQTMQYYHRTTGALEKARKLFDNESN